MLFIQNPLYTALADYTKRRNNLCSYNVGFLSNYKSFDQKDNSVIKFRLWDIQTDIIKCDSNADSNKSSPILGTVSYSGTLDFVVDESMQIVYIYKLPTIKHLNQEINVCTGDIIRIINEKASKYLPQSDFKLQLINDFEIASIDERANKEFPSIANTRSYKTLMAIIQKIEKEEDRIAQDVKEYKAKQDRQDRAIENSLSKKRKIFGIDPEKIVDSEERERVVKDRIRQVYAKRLENAKRHYEKSKTKYIDILTTIPDFVYHEETPKKLDYWWRENIKKSPYTYALQYDEDGNLIDFKTFVDRVIEVDTTIGAIEHIRMVQLENLGTPLSAKEAQDWSYYGGQKYIDDYNYTFYGQLLSWLPDSPCMGWIFKTRGEKFERGIDLIMQLSELKNQIQVYEEIVNSPDSKIISSFSQENGNWGNIMSQPAFIRYGRDHTGTPIDRVGYHLLMVKPGVSSFDFENIKKYTRRNGYEFGRKVAERHKNLKALALETKRLDVGGRAVCMLPSSLNFEQTNQIINEALFGFCDNIFVVDDPSQATQVKRIIYNHFIAEIKQIQQEWEIAQTEIRGREYEMVDGKYLQYSVNSRFLSKLRSLESWNRLTGIVVDKDYYKHFFVKTPTNKNLYLDLCKNPKYGIKNIAEEFFGLLNNEYNRLHLFVSERIFHETSVAFGFERGRTLYHNCLELFKQIDWEKIDEEYLGGYSSYGIDSNEKAEFRSMLVNMPQEIYQDNEPDYSADLSELFDFQEEASFEEYLNALELGLIKMDIPECEE